MIKPDFVFEASWEICNKIGGIYTVLSSKAAAMESLLNNNYLLIGPDVWKETEKNPDFLEDPQLFGNWPQLALQEGLKIRTGRWNIPSKPAVVLIDYTSFFAGKDKIFAHWWETYKLDSLTGQWDYIEPAIFGYAAGKTIENFFLNFLDGDAKAIAHFHEWMTGAGILYLKEHVPQIGTVFTTHATVLGRSIAGNGLPLYGKLQEYNPEITAKRFRVISKNSLETMSAAHADSFTTVSEITALECGYLLKKKPDTITINGFTNDIVPKKDYAQKRKTARDKALEIASKLTGTLYDDGTRLIMTGGRYEYRNKGIDLFIKSLHKLNKLNAEGGTQPRTVAFIAVPAGHDGVSPVFSNNAVPEGIFKFVTHKLHNPQYDPILNEIKSKGFTNSSDQNVHIIFLPAYLNTGDGVAGLSYYDFLTGFDYSVFPSYYEPWGYTPMESIALGIPTLTTSVAGFGNWIHNNFEVKNKSVTVINRGDGEDDAAVEQIVSAITDFFNSGAKEKATAEAFEIFENFLWDKLIVNYQKSWDTALQEVSRRKPAIKIKLTRPAVSKIDAVANKDFPVWKKILVQNQLSEELLPLKELAYNLWWSWDAEAVELFKSIKPEKWDEFEQNAVSLVEDLSLKTINKLKNDKEFLVRLNSVYKRFKEYMKDAGKNNKDLVAYFSMEYGLHNSIKIYSGGLGILAGDYLKQASDSHKNMIAVGLLYRYGYFIQKLSHFGDQIAEYPPQKFTRLPLKPVRDKKGEWVKIRIALPGRFVTAKAWQLDVGRIPLYLLDTDIEENNPEDRQITAHLYGGDREHRLKQEMLLGLGGIRLIEAIGKKPAIYHSNEGHSAFIGIERIHKLMDKYHLDFDAAKEYVRATTLFTTHTPVPAGHDVFEEHLIRAYLSHFCDYLQISWDEFIALGRFNPYDAGEKFSMSVLATKLSQEVNGVSKIHGRVSREMFAPLFKGYYPEELHIGYVTNGVHFYTWTHKQWQHLYKKTFGQIFVENQSDKSGWEKIYDIPDKTIWELRLNRKRELINFVKKRLQHDLTERQESPKIILESMKYLDEDALIVGFARRFATYKRAHLLFADLERLKNIVNNSGKQVIFIFAGKAHPADKAGQDLIKRIVEISKMPDFIGKIIFLENYDMVLGKMLTGGVDVWLNTPTRPLEASGTSGEKAVMNGVVNFSVLDGWWAEGYTPGAGWAVDETRTYENQRFQDELDAEIIYNTFENEIIPVYFEKDKNAVSKKWVSHIKKTIAEIAPHFTMHRMINDYYAKFYSSLIENSKSFMKNDFENVKILSQWKKKVREAWDNISVETLIVPDADKGAIAFGKNFVAEIVLNIPGLNSEDIGVEILMGNRVNGDIDEIVFKKELSQKKAQKGKAAFTCSFPLTHAGVYDYSFRIFPKHPLLRYKMDFPLVKWI
jgi:phosphorylase/glycogen(starch) synthase